MTTSKLINMEIDDRAEVKTYDCLGKNKLPKKRTRHNIKTDMILLIDISRVYYSIFS